jgi:hypothetical protein
VAFLINKNAARKIYRRIPLLCQASCISLSDPCQLSEILITAFVRSCACLQVLKSLQRFMRAVTACYWSVVVKSTGKPISSKGERDSIKRICPHRIFSVVVLVQCHAEVIFDIEIQRRIILFSKADTAR